MNRTNIFRFLSNMSPEQHKRAIASLDAHIKIEVLEALLDNRVFNTSMDWILRYTSEVKGKSKEELKELLLQQQTLYKSIMI